MSGTPPRAADAAFRAQLDLLHVFLARRGEIVERIAALLNAQRKPPHYLQDAALLARHVDDCFFALPGIAAEQAALKRALEDARVAGGFKPRAAPGLHNDLVDPGELMTRAFLLWQRTRWPGHDGRVRYAHTLFNLYLLRRLMLLCLRIWDSEPRDAGARLEQLQHALDALWRTQPAQPVFVRDARSLFALALSPTTDELHGYLEITRLIAETLPREDLVAIQKANVRMAGGHLRSQLRHVATQQGVPLDEHGLVLSTRKSNTLDLATLIQGLVPLLEAYERAARDGAVAARLDLADAICQGISPDPELFLNRLELLAPYSMLEYLFIATQADGSAAYTPLGERHVRLVDDYNALIARLAQPLADDCAQFRPVAGRYSPYGTLYGFSSQLIEHMALKTVQPEAVTRFSVEDVFTSGDADKLAWVAGWRKLPHVPRDVAKLFDYPQQFAEDVFERILRALQERASAAAPVAARTGRLFVVPIGAAAAPNVPDLPVEYLLSSDRQLATERKARLLDEAQLLDGRTEGEHLVSYETPRGWCAVSKDALTDVMGAGCDAKLVGLPRAAARALELMCPGLVSLAPGA